MFGYSFRNNKNALLLINIGVVDGQVEGLGGDAIPLQGQLVKPNGFECRGPGPDCADGKPLHFFHYNHSNNLALKRIPIYYLIPY